MGFECVSRTHVGLRRKVNEDALLVRTEHGLWAVADGMGGHEAGEVASGMIVDALSRLQITDEPEQVVGDAVAALGRVNRQLIELAHADPRPKTIGSTVVGLAIQSSRVGLFWAGDSRAYRLRGGALQRLSRDHSLVQGLVDAGMLEPEEAEHHPDANVITRAVGAATSLTVDTLFDEVASGDCYLLASDGLTRVINDVELGAALGEPSLEAIANGLIDTVLERGAPDNVSLVIIRAG